MRHKRSADGDIDISKLSFPAIALRRCPQTSSNFERPMVRMQAIYWARTQAREIVHAKCRSEGYAVVGGRASLLVESDNLLLFSPG